MHTAHFRLYLFPLLMTLMPEQKPIIYIYIYIKVLICGDIYIYIYNRKIKKERQEELVVK